MGIMTDYLKNKTISFIFRGSDFKAPDTIWMGLFNDGLELIGKGYERELISFDSATNGILKNSHDIVFHYAIDKWKDVDSVALFDEKDGGTMLSIGSTKEKVVVPKDKNFVIKTHMLHVGFE